MSHSRIISPRIRVTNEYGRLREAVVGIEDDTIEPDYVEALCWLERLDPDTKKFLAERAGQRIAAEASAGVRAQLERHVQTLESHGVVVHRTASIADPNEKTFLANIQRGNMLFGGADFFRVIGETVILLNSFRLPFRRKQVFAVRPVLEKLLMGTDVRYVSTPFPFLQYFPEDLFLENGDIMVDGRSVFVGHSGNASSKAGIEWLRRLLGREYTVYTIELAADRFHLDWVLGLNRWGVLTYCPAALKDGEAGLPAPLRRWTKIVVNADENAGANNLSLDENTIVVPEQYERICKLYEQHGFKVITEPLNYTIAYGSGPRCLTAVLCRDS
jgi:N-dimethylarginine dimethylaminohydrolase